MDEWKPILVLPNLDMQGVVQCEHAAIVCVTEARIEKLRKDHSRFHNFLNRFKGQFKQQVWPSVLILKTDAPRSYYTAEAVSAFRDLLALSVIPYARTTPLRFNRGSGWSFSNAFSFYPWMIDNDYKEITLINPAQVHGHMLKEFAGQSFAEQWPASLMAGDIDVPLCKVLMRRWSIRYSEGSPDWKDKALFRSLNMANEASKIPALTASSFYDAGRTLALWVSAYEILVHPGGDEVSNKWKVFAELEKVQWKPKKLQQAAHEIGTEKKPKQAQLATWICKRIYGLRDDFLHGNDVQAKDLLLNEKQIVFFAACLYRMVVTGAFDIHFKHPMPAIEDTKKMGKFISDRMRFNDYQRAYEDALLTAL